MTGENFIRLDRGRDIKEAKEKLQKAKNEHGKYEHMAGDPNWSFDKMDKLTRKVEEAEYELYCLEYERDRH